MDWITDDIAIGNYLDAQDAALLQREGIRSVICLDRTLQGKNPADMGLKIIEAIPLDDGPGNDVRLFHRAVDALTHLRKNAGPVLVQCHAGRSRSAVVVAGHFMRTQVTEVRLGNAMASVQGHAKGPSIYRQYRRFASGRPCHER